MSECVDDKNEHYGYWLVAIGYWLVAQDAHYATVTSEHAYTDWMALRISMP